MAENTINVKVKQRTDTESNWASKNPVLLKGEMAISSDKNNKYKIGDGTSTWSVLSYAKADLSKSDVTTALGYTPPTTNTTYNDVTQSTHGLMTAADKKKLDGIASGATKVTVDSTLSSTSTNPVQNKVINSALTEKSNKNHTHDLSTMINTLSTGTATPIDDDYYISQYSGGGTTTTTYHRRPVKALFEYIKGKLSKVAVSGSYNDLSNKPAIPTVGNGTVTIKQAGTSKGTFSMNQSGNTTIELTDNNSWRGIQNNLTSDSTSESLSAAQGKVLKGLVDGKGMIGYYGSDTANSGGWYKVCTGSLSGWADTVLTLLITQSYARIASGVLHVHLRCDNNTTVLVKALEWMYRYGFSPEDVKIVTGTNTWSIYVFQSISQYGRIQVKVLSKAGTSGDTSFSLSDNNTKESSTPGGTAATDGATVSYANSAGNTSKVNNHTVNADVPSGAKFTDTNTWRPLGTTADTACAGNDSRLSNARPANGGNSTTVNGHTVNSNVPANAKFTDTIYAIATTSANGLMSKDMVTKLNGIASGATAVTSTTVSNWGFKKTDTNTWRGVQNNLTSTATDQSLSAYQGKVLKDLVDKKTTFTYSSTQPTSPASNAVWIG